LRLALGLGQVGGLLLGGDAPRLGLDLGLFGRLEA
jgi:hypothetical protein